LQKRPIILSPYKKDNIHISLSRTLYACAYGNTYIDVDIGIDIDIVVDVDIDIVVDVDIDIDIDKDVDTDKDIDVCLK